MSHPARQNMSVGGCMPPCSPPFSHGTPARNATSAIAVQSIISFPRIASRPALLSMVTPRTRSLSITDTGQVREEHHIHAAFEQYVECDRIFTASGSISVMLTCSGQGRCSLAALRIRSRSMNRCGKPLMIGFTFLTEKSREWADRW